MTHNKSHTVPAPAHRSTRIWTDQIDDLLGRAREQLTVGIVCAGELDGPDGPLLRTHSPRGFKRYTEVAHDLRATLLRLGFHEVHVIEEGRRLAERLDELDVNLVWLNSAGIQGYDSICHAAAQLESLGIAYIGHRPGDAALLDDKGRTKTILQTLGVRTSPAATWSPVNGPMTTLDGRSFEEVFDGHDGAFIVKPVTGRASLGIRVVERAADLDAVLREQWQQNHNLQLIEAYLPGREFCVACSGRARWQRGQPRLDELAFAFAPLERIHAPGESIFESMDQRPITAIRARPILEAEEPTLHAELTDIARRIYQGLHLGYLIRLDLREDSQGRLNVLEVNPKPDLKAPSPTKTSLVALGAAAEGLDYDDLILSQVVDFLHQAMLEPRAANLSMWRALGRSSSRAGGAVVPPSPRFPGLVAGVDV